MNSLAKHNAHFFTHRRNILGDPWKNEVYGYRTRLAHADISSSTTPFCFAPGGNSMWPGLMGFDAPVDAGGSHFALSRPNESSTRGMELSTRELGSGGIAAFRGPDIESWRGQLSSRRLPPRALSSSDLADAGIELKLLRQSSADGLTAQFLNAAESNERIQEERESWTTDLPTFGDGPHILAIPVRLRENGRVAIRSHGR